MRPDFVGRAREVAALEGVLDRIRVGEPAVMELVGDAGIGKTRLLDALCERGEARGFLALRGRAAQFEQDVPFQVFVDALDDYLGSLNPRLFEPLAEDERVELARLFPTLTDLAEGRQPALETERYRAHGAVRVLLELLARRKPVVVVVDDLHWADEGSQELVSFLLRRRPRAPVLLALAYRRGQAPARLVGVMDRAVAEEDCERIEVGGLSEDETRQLLGHELPPEACSDLHRETGGNPFYLEQLSRAAPATRGSRLDGRGADRTEGVPPSVLASLAQELEGVGAAARRLLEGAAVIGDPFELDLARESAGLDEAEALSGLDLLLERDLVRGSAAPREFRFRHPIVRRAVYNGAPSGWRLAAHARTARVLAARGAPVTERAHHVEHSASPGDAGAVALLEEAGHRASARAPANAAHWFDAALRLLPGGDAAAERRIEMLVSKATALGACGKLERSRDAMREALAMIPPAAIEARTRAAVGCAMMEYFLRRKHDAERLLMDTLAGLDDRTSAEAAETALALGTINLFDDDHDSARRWSDRAVEGARTLGLDSLEAAATAVLAHCEARLGNVTDAHMLASRAAALVDPLPDSLLAERLDALLWIALAQFHTELYDESLRHSNRGAAIARASGQGRWLPQLVCVRMWANDLSGRLDEAIRDSDDAAEMARLTGDRHFEALSLVGGIDSLTSAGELSKGLRNGERATELAGTAAGDSGDYVSVLVGTYTGVNRLAAGEAESARRMILEATGGPGLPRIEPVWRPLTWLELTLADVALGDLAAAEEWAARATADAERLGLPGRRGGALHARAAVLLARGDPHGAARIAREAADSFGESRVRVHQGRAQILAAQALTAAGDHAQAVVELERAHSLLDACGANHYRDLAAQELRRLGERVSRPQRQRDGMAVGSLSDRELEIAELVGEGKTNKEIAAALFLSEKTVEKHLGRVFEKLGVSRRGAVASQLAREREGSDGLSRDG